MVSEQFSMAEVTALTFF